MITTSVIFVNYNSKNLIRQNVLEIEKNNKDNNLEVVVVDNASSDGSAETIAQLAEQLEHTKLHLIASDKNGGFAYGLNLGLQKASGDTYLMLNPDVVYSHSAYQQLAVFLQEHPKVGLVAPKLVQPNGIFQPSCFTLPRFLTPMYRRTFFQKTAIGKREVDRYLMRDKNITTPQRVEWVQGSCMLVKKEAVEKVGLMDERFFMYFEDIDWCRRFNSKGFEVWYYPEATMIHYFNRWSAEQEGIAGLSNRATWIHIHSWLNYFRKWVFSSK